jgi:hypothetical protein
MMKWCVTKRYDLIESALHSGWFDKIVGYGRIKII